jgi:hypothetical protein
VHSLNFIDISKYYTNEASFANIRFSNGDEKQLFKMFTKHPLLLWHLELIQDTVIVPFDLITNITGNINHSGAVRINGIHFVHSPCLVCEYGNFTNTYNKRSEHELYQVTRNLVEEYRTRTLFSVLNAKNFNGSIFYQQGFQGWIDIGLKE